ncbi:caspase-3-like [Gigantopelta aegis]|uniref:caspase-3-like n=1 Tax=Gigantopelta aegis TaxID=1735272 RepID=UPI001B888653|nr:caspase-3-like [Gigantopelta aegis]
MMEIIFYMSRLFPQIALNETLIYYIGLIISIFFLNLYFECVSAINEHSTMQEQPNDGDRDIRTRSDKYYDMEANPKGICLIINNECFTNSPTRKGSAKDVERLKCLFEKFGFVVEIKKNLKSSDLLEELKSVSVVGVKPEHNCFVCFISSHGVGKSIIGTDEELVSISKIKEFFSASQCRALVGKPKMFFVQACRNDQKKPVSLWRSDVTGEPQSDFSDRHTDSDFLLAFATTPGSDAFRDEAHGSLFIYHLVRILDENSHEDLLSVLTQLNDIFSVPAKLGVKQMSKFESTLTKKVVLGKRSCN